MGHRCSFGRIYTAATASSARCLCALRKTIGTVLLAVLLMAAPPAVAVEDTGGWENPAVAEALEEREDVEIPASTQPLCPRESTP